MTGEDVRETVGLIALVASLIFVGAEIRQNTIVARATAYQDIGFATAESYRAMAMDREWAELNVLARDSSRWNEIDEAGWLQLQWRLTGGMRAWETVYLQVQQGLLPQTAMQRFGYDVSPRLYWAYFDRIWPQIRGIMDSEFADYLAMTYHLDLTAESEVRTEP